MERTQKSAQCARKRTCLATSQRAWKSKTKADCNPVKTKTVDKKPEIKQEVKTVQKKSVEPTAPLICSVKKKDSFWENLKKWLTIGWQSTDY